MSLTAGLHDVAPDEYHNDPAEEPSLSSSGIKRLLSGSPAQFAANHPRLTRWKEELDDECATEAMDAGSIAHAIVLGKGARYVEMHPSDYSSPKTGKPYESWSGKAKEAREAEKAKGNIVLTRGGERSAKIEAACASMRDLLVEEYGDWPLGESERTVIWQRQTSHGPIWCRAMVDHLALQHMLVLDVKFTGNDIDDRSLQKKAAFEMWHIQQEWYTEGLTKIAPQLGLQLIFRFVVAQLHFPYEARFVDLPLSWLHVAETRITRAAGTFARCLRGNIWPGLEKVAQPQPPDWLLREYEEEEMHG